MGSIKSDTEHPVTDKVYNADCARNSANATLIEALTELPNWESKCECINPIGEYVDTKGDGTTTEFCLKCGGELDA